MAMDRRRVAVTGMGVVSPSGNDCETFFANLLAGRSGIRRLSAGFAQLGACVVGEVDYDPGDRYPPAKLALLDRFTQFALEATAQAVGDAGLRFEGTRAGVYLGTGMGGAGTLQTAYEDLLVAEKGRVSPYTVLRSMANSAAGHISIDYAVRGPSITYSTGCSSASVAIGEACRAIRHGYIDAAIAGGSESTLSPGNLIAWESLRTLAVPDTRNPGASCRPFSRDRTGLVLAEGAGIVVLESLEHAARRGAAIHAELAGFGAASDAEHMTRPCLEGQVQAMRQALADAGIDADEVDYINAHGTATMAGDVTETSAIKRVFGERAAAIPVSSTKSMHGHLMGAAGAVEFIAAVMAIRRGAVPPTANLRVPDPECDLDYVPNAGREVARLRTAMSNSFAFGGSNAVLVARALGSA
jgi:3-oxoacyl-[acyl-carrier-protein] synthase II